MKQYLEIAIPSFLFMIIEYSAHEILMLFAGIIGIKAAATQVICFMIWGQFISGAQGF